MDELVGRGGGGVSEARPRPLLSNICILIVKLCVLGIPCEY